MWSAKPRREPITPKQILENVQSLATIGAVVLGGIWTAYLFHEERKTFPHLNIEHKISHVDVAKGVRLLRVGIELNNTGSTQAIVDNVIIRVQQILPLSACPEKGACAGDEMNDTMNTTVMTKDRFSWPLLTKREFTSANWQRIEPGEKQPVDFEFAIHSHAQVVRVYTYFRNDRMSKKCPGSAGAEPMQPTEICEQSGWDKSSYYDMRAKTGGDK